MSANKASHRAACIAAGVLAAFSLACSPAFADNRHRHDDRRQEDRQQDQPRRPGANQGARMSLDEAVRRAERVFNARVVKAESRNIDGRMVYVLRLVSDDGRVFTVRVDAESGNMS
jgi:uncharacterized membrane protein YkoI